MRLLQLSRFLVFVILLASSLGCASFRGDRLGVVPPFWHAPTPTPRRSVDVQIAIRVLFNGKHKDVDKETVESFKRGTLQAYSESGYFSSADKANTESELRAEVSITDQAESVWFDYPNVGAFLQVQTLGLLPFRITSVLTARTSFKDQDGRELGSLEKAEVIHTWQQLFLIFALPFAKPDSVFEAVVYDVSRATLVDAAQRGWLESRRDVTPVTAP